MAAVFYICDRCNTAFRASDPGTGAKLSPLQCPKCASTQYSTEWDEREDFNCNDACEIQEEMDL